MVDEQTVVTIDATPVETEVAVEMMTEDASPEQVTTALETVSETTSDAIV